MKYGGLIGDPSLSAPAESREVRPESFGFAEYGKPRVLAFPTRVTERYNRKTAIPLLGYGDCLAPWFVEGDITWHDPTVEPQNGDLVAVEMTYRRLSGGGDTVRLTAIKQYQVVESRGFSGSQRYLVCNQGCVAADGAKLLGTVTAWRRPRWWRRPSVRDMRFLQMGGANWSKEGYGNTFWTKIRLRCSEFRWRGSHDSPSHRPFRH